MLVIAVAAEIAAAEIHSKKLPNKRGEADVEMKKEQAEAPARNTVGRSRWATALLCEEMDHPPLASRTLSSTRPQRKLGTGLPKARRKKNIERQLGGEDEMFTLVVIK